MNLLQICGIIASVAGAVTAINKWIVQPLKHITSKLEKIEKIEEGQRILIRSEASTLQHIITGDHIEELKKHQEELFDFILKN